jgi:hypothetical protein
MRPSSVVAERLRPAGTTGGISGPKRPFGRPAFKAGDGRAVTHAVGISTLSQRRAGLRPATLALAAVAGAWVLWILFLPTHPWSKHISNLGLTVMPLVAAVQCARQAGGVSGRLRRGWLLMAGSCLAWGTGMVVWSSYESLGGREVPFPSLADLGYLAAVPLGVAALLAFPTAPQRRAAQIRTVVDGAIIGASLLIVSWILALGPVVRSGGTGLLADVIGIAYPLGDVVVATIGLFAIARSRRLAGPLGRSTLVLLCAGLLASAVSDSGFSYLALQESYASGSRIDIGWFMGYVLIFLAASRAPRHGASTMEAPLTSRSAIVVPCVTLALAAVTVAVHLAITGVTDPFVVWTGLVLFLALVLRQVLTSLDNMALVKTVETWVATPRRNGTAVAPAGPRPTFSHRCGINNRERKASASSPDLPVGTALQRQD